MDRDGEVLSLESLCYTKLDLHLHTEVTETGIVECLLMDVINE